MIIPLKLGINDNTKILNFLGPQDWIRSNTIIKANRRMPVTNVDSLTLLRIQLELPFEGPLKYT